MRLPVGSPARVIVIGAGLAGFSAALTAQALGAQVELFAAGMGRFTLMPGWIETGDVIALSADPAHPYHHAAAGLAVGLGLLERAAGLQPFNAEAVSAIGHLRPVAFAAGGALYPVSSADRVCVVGVEGWRDSYPHWAADALSARGISSEAITVSLPHFEGNFDDWSFDFARYVDTDAGRADLLAQVRPRLNGATAVAFPAILGFAPETRRRIANLLGMPVFELPTLPASVPGQRLFRALRAQLLANGGRLTFGPRVHGLELRDGRATGVPLETAAHGRPRIVPADAVILATGGLYGGGLDSDYKGNVWETVLGVPVANVPPITDWFSEPLLAGRPQPIHRAGVRTDALLRPLTADGAPFAENVYAAGHVLAGASPVMEGSAEGIDLATGAQAALNAVAALGEGIRVTAR
jgi:glycerol-3-phosphate dehydrogenase subunit B